jgi:hypothetical protein
LAVAQVYTTMSFSNAMRALVQSSWEGPRHLQHVSDAPVPLPGPSEILVRVAAAGVNFADKQKVGWFAAPFGAQCSTRPAGGSATPQLSPSVLLIFL